MKNLNIEALNKELQDKTPQEIIAWALSIAKTRWLQQILDLMKLQYYIHVHKLIRI